MGAEPHGPNLTARATGAKVREALKMLDDKIAEAAAIEEHIFCTCASYYNVEDMALDVFCPIHGDEQ